MVDHHPVSKSEIDLGDSLGMPYDSGVFLRERALRLSVDLRSANATSLVYSVPRNLSA